MPDPTCPPDALLGPHSLVQSGLRERPWWATRRLDAVVLARGPDGLVAEHHHRSQARPDAVWVGPTPLATGVIGPAAIAWTPAGLHVLAPLADGVASSLRPPGSPAFSPMAQLPRAEHVATAVAGGVLHALLVCGGHATHWRLDAVADSRAADSRALAEERPVRRVSKPSEPPAAVSAPHRWAQVGELGGVVTGQPTLAAVGRHGLVAVAPTTAGLASWRFDGRWRREATVTDAGTAPAALARDGRGVLLAVPRGSALECWRATATGGWAPAGSAQATGGAQVVSVALAPTALGAPRPDGDGGWLQALVQEGDSVFQLQRQVRRPLRDPRGVRHRWARSGCLRLVEPDAGAWASAPSVKLAQVSGDTDTQPWPDGPRPTLSASGRTAGVRGTDLGVRVEVGGASYLLCGDTHWTSRWRGTKDAIASITDEGPLPGLPGFTFHGGPIALRGPATVREYDVPLDAFEWDGDWFLFASSHHFARHQTMGRSVLARALDDPARIDPSSRRALRFRVLATVSDFRFVNISCQWVDGRAAGAGVDRPVLALWGAGSYRADDLRLAILDVHAIAPRLRGGRRLPAAALGLRFWAGTAGGRPVWSDRESAARPVLAGAFGEVSVRWVEELERFVLLGMTGPGDPAGRAVWLRVSRTPWGPWSPRLLLFDWIADGMSFGDPTRRFIRALAEGDPVGDAIFAGQSTATGGAYAPYVFDARADGGDIVLRYTLSTWNPYQIVLMEHRLGAADLAALRLPA